MMQGQIVYSFFIVDQGLLYLESLFITENLSEAIRYAEDTTSDYLINNGYDTDNFERATDDGYAILVKSRYGVPADEYQEVLWNYRMDGEETVRYAIEQIK